MIYHQISFDNNNDKTIDYNLLLDTTYYTSPTLSTPLSSPTNSLIQDEISMYQQQNVSSAPTSAPQQGSHGFSRGNTSHPQQDDWLLGTFYDASTFAYNPLLPLDSAQGNHTINAALQPTSPIINHYNNHQNFDSFQSVMVMNDGSTDTTTSLGQHNQQNHGFNHQQMEQNVKSNNEPVSSASSSSSPPTATPAKTKKKSNKKKPVPYAHQMRSLNFGYPAKTGRAYSSTRASSSTAPSPQPPTSSSSSSSSSSVTTSPSTSLYSASTTTASASDKGKNRNKAASPYQCDFPGCQKSFTRPYNLKSHHRTHTNERPFECPHCNKAFARQHDRNRHAKLHFGIKPYFCGYCYKAFARQDALTRHQTWVDESGVIGCSSLKRKSRKGSHPQQ